MEAWNGGPAPGRGARGRPQRPLLPREAPTRNGVKDGAEGARTPSTEQGAVHGYLGILKSLRPPALGGQPVGGRVARGIAVALAHLAGVVESTPLGGVLKMVVGEARNFPEVARVWHDELVSQALGAMAAAIEAAQARGEVRPGDPRIYALQLIAPLLVAVLWRETFVPIGARPFDQPALMRQHVETYLRGVLLEGTRT